MTADFDRWLEDAASGVERVAASGKPDFESVLSDMEETDDEEFASWLGEARRGVDRVSEPTSRPPSFENVLCRIERDASPEGSSAADEAEASPIERRRAPWFLVAIAAALVGTVGWAFLSSNRDAWREDPNTRQEAANARSRSANHEANMDGRAARQAPARPPEMESPAPTAPQSTDTPDSPTSEALPDESSVSTAPTRPARHNQGPNLDDLADRADTQWKAGDLAGAQTTLRQLVRRAGRSDRAQMAYADLFTIAKQRGADAERRKLFRAYLRKFPKGRFSEDARAGLCRSGSDPTRCWTKYLEQHPTGSYVSEAKEALK